MLVIVIIIILNFICIYNYTKVQTLYLYIIIMDTNDVCLFPCIYKMNDISNIHVKSFYLQYVKSFQMSRGTVNRSSSDTFCFG